MIVRERNGNSVPACSDRRLRSKLDQIPHRKGTVVNADEAPSWDDLHGPSK